MANVTIGGRDYEVEVQGDTVVVDGKPIEVSVRDEKDYISVNAGGTAYRVQLPPEGERESGMDIQVDYRPFTLEYEGRLTSGPAPRKERPVRDRGATGGAGGKAAKGAITAQLAGKVFKVLTEVGASVTKGDVLLILEAMKMENEIKSPADGTVKELPVAEGDQVTEGQTLAVVE